MITLADSDVQLIKQKTAELIDKVFVDETYPYTGTDHVMTENYIVKIIVCLNNDGIENKATARFVLKERDGN